MNKLFNKIAALLLAAALMTTQGAVTRGFAETAQTTASSGESAQTPETSDNDTKSMPVVINYYLIDSKDKEIQTLRINSEFKMRLVIRDLAVKTSDIKGAEDIDFIKTLDTFKGTLSKVEITSAQDALLTYTVELSGCKWTGNSNEFGFMTGYLSKGSDYSTLSVTVRECAENVAEVPDNDDAVAEPIFSVKANTDGIVLKAGDEGTFDLTIKNLGSVTAERALVEIVAPNDMMVTESTASQEIKYLTSGDSTTITVGYKALDKINGSKQTFTVNITYYYEIGMDELRGSTSTSFNIASEISTVEKVYPVVLSEFSLAENELSPDSTYDGTITLTNIGTADMKGIFVNLTDNESFILTGGTSFCYIESLEQGASVEVPVKIKTLSEIATIKLPLEMSVKYTYVMGSDELDGSYDKTFIMFAPISQGTAPRPVLTLTTLDEPISGGHSYTFNIGIENKGDLPMENVSLSIKGSEGIIVAKDSDSAYFEKISAGKKKVISVRFRTQASLTSAIQYFTVAFNYDFTAAGQKETVKDERTLSLDAKISSAPVLRITGQRLEEAIKPDSEYEYTLTVHNYGDIPVKNVMIDLSSSDSIYFVDGTEFAQISKIRSGSSADITVKFRTTEKISSIRQTITAAIKFVYGTTAAQLSGEATSTITVIASTDSDSSAGGQGAAPNVIVGGYDIGADQIPAGEIFDLSFDVYNTSSQKQVENLVITVDASGSLSIYGGGNTFFYNSLGAAASLNETVKLRALPTAETGTSSITISFKYDYVDGDQRNTLTANQTIYIPVYQPDKMTFDVSVPTYSVYTGYEVYITTSYMNKGRSDISNVKAELVGDVGALSTSKVIGTVVPGGNGTFDFIVTPYMSGECSFVIKVTYENAMLEEIVKEIPVSFNVEEMTYYEEDYGDWDFSESMDANGENGGFPWWIVWVGAGVVVVGGVVTLICVLAHKKKKAKKLTADDIDWEDDLDEILTDGTDKDKTTKV